MNYSIKQCHIEDAETYTDHCIYHLQEKGIGDIYVNPFPVSQKWDRKDFLQKITNRWSQPQFAPNWEIAWVAFVDGKMAGHVNLKCGPIDAAAHRMRLGMGLLTPYRSMGIGRALIETAISWAREQEQISWLDLSVFSKNEVALKLYEKVGFKKVYVIEDALRVDGELIDDIQMIIKLR